MTTLNPSLARQDTSVAEQHSTQFEQTAEHFRKAAESVEKAASQVEAQVAGGIQPDVRELRIHVSEIQETANRRMKRLEWGLIGLAVLNGAVLFVVVAH